MNELNEFLYVFGYESPEERKSNDECGTDFESSGSVRILAKSEEDALAWGAEIAERFIKELYQSKMMSWKEDGFSGWIEKNPESQLIEMWNVIPMVEVGEYPPNEALVSSGSSE